MNRNDITTIWAENELIGMDLDTTPITDIVEELANRIFIALDIQDDDEDTQDWAFERAERIALNIA
jgi:phosphoribosylformimino-5-aminoimidazole carboxamide ribonucleotide (ProFAR) isomerase